MDGEVYLNIFNKQVLVVITILGCAISQPLDAQDNVLTGSVKDAQGAALVGATVVAIMPESGVSEAVLTD